MTNYSRSYRALMVLKDLEKAEKILTKAATELQALGQSSMSQAIDEVAQVTLDEYNILAVIQGNWEENDAK